MSTTQIELERKFLIKSLPADLSPYKKHRISQAYIEIDDTTKSSTRIRQKDDTYIRTTKVPNPHGEGNIETESFVSREEYEEALESYIGFIVKKTRYLIPYGEFIIELDVFSGELDSLIIAEVEFQSEAQANSFVAPEWFGDEVTRDKRYANKNLCRNGLPK